MNIAVAAFTAHGRELQERIQQIWPEHSFALFNASTQSAREWTKTMFHTCDALIFIGATGIAVRLIAAWISTKDRDPAVLVVDEKGRFVIALLSGHIGGANRLARNLAAALGAEPVITTATDIQGVFAVDEWSKAWGCTIADISRIKNISAALLAGERVGFCSDFPVDSPLPAGISGPAEIASQGAQPVGICVSLNAHKKPFACTLNVIPKIGILGAGCRRGIGPEAFESFVLETLEQQAFSPLALHTLASISLKKNEPCLSAFASKYGLNFITFTAEELERVPGTFTGSGFVKKVTGVDNVCERSAMASGGERLLIPKTSTGGISLALAVPNWECHF